MPARETQEIRDRDWHLTERRERGRAEYLEPFLGSLEIKDGMTVVDLGCGSGYVSDYVGKHFKLRLNIGMDLDPATVSLAAQVSPADNLIAWTCGSAEAIPLSDASVDAVICRAVIPLVIVDRVVSEIGRILKPGGRAVLSLHSWKFYLSWLSLDPRKWKRSLAGLIHFGLGLWFNLTGHQYRIHIGRHTIGQTFQTAPRMRRVLQKHGMQMFKIGGKPELVAYAIRIPPERPAGASDS